MCRRHNPKTYLETSSLQPCTGSVKPETMLNTLGGEQETREKRSSDTSNVWIVRLNLCQEWKHEPVLCGGGGGAVSSPAREPAHARHVASDSSAPLPLTADSPVRAHRHHRRGLDGAHDHGPTSTHVWPFAGGLDLCASGGAPTRRGRDVLPENIQAKEKTHIWPFAAVGMR